MIHLILNVLAYMIFGGNTFHRKWTLFSAYCKWLIIITEKNVFMYSVRDGPLLKKIWLTYERAYLWFNTFLWVYVKKHFWELFLLLVKISPNPSGVEIMPFVGREKRAKAILNRVHSRLASQWRRLSYWMPVPPTQRQTTSLFHQLFSFSSDTQCKQWVPFTVIRAGVLFPIRHASCYGYLHTAEKAIREP